MAASASGGAVEPGEMLELKRMLMDQQRQIEELRRELRAQKPASRRTDQRSGTVSAGTGVLTKQRSIAEGDHDAPMVPPTPLTIRVSARRLRRNP